MRVFTYQSIVTSLLVLANASSVRAEAHGDYAACKAFPGTTDWPSEESWTKFNTSIGGKLIEPGPPPGAVCHPRESTFNPYQCAFVAAAWGTYDFHQNSPVSNMWQQFNNDTCLVGPNTPCSGAGYPAYVVNATTAMDIKLSLDFARKHNVRVVVKSTGHDFQGRSQAPGALSIWVHHMQSYKAHDAFRPTGCNFTIDTHAVTVGGGSQLGGIYEELDKINRTIVAGNSKSVSVGGFLTGGGHSILSPHYGLGADHILELEVVTPVGDILIANECQNEDLFWAMRGGGGSTFGVMTSVTLATHPTPKIVAGIIALYGLVNEPWVQDLIGYIASQFPYLVSNDVSGYAFFTYNTTTPNANNGIDILSGLIGEFMITDTQDIKDMQTIWEPILTHIKTTWPATVIMESLNPYSSFYSWFTVFYDQGAAGYNHYVGSRLLDEKALSINSTTLGKVFTDARASAYLVAGKGVREAKPRGGGLSVTPTWRRAVVHAVNGRIFTPLNSEARAEALKFVDNHTEPLRQLAPDMGAYVNENNPGERDWQHAFWGENYERLLQIKRTYDPEDVLWCAPCVGNERWEQIGYRLCRIDESSYKTDWTAGSHEHIISQRY
ncbi:hypothetical protein ONZ43_g688 [Nemania bipapillata]|uniref:Uncharacterized protein n=1 Tax=Nemania bipapillata TaxID=110536 RepID=A0ACC2J7H8_9PEZI|nr:hypothetical protein ONZ43_g688 [Nemania bipapillata]